MEFNYELKFKLTTKQLECSMMIVESYLNKRDCVLDAVCGAGKTEILLEVIKVALNKEKKVGFSCPRKQLTIELYTRIQECFNHPNIGLVVGGESRNINSNLIFLTTHQLSKYENYFDLLIIDEVDAFPFCDNYELENAAFKASKQFIYVSATLPYKYYVRVKLGKLDHVKNYERYHRKDIPNISFIKVNRGTMPIHLFKLILKYRNKLIIFVPSISIGNKLTKYLKILRINVENINSKTLDNSKLSMFKKNEIAVLVSTTVLERGITLRGLNIIIYDGSNKLFTKDVLIQMAGRVGRDSIEATGNVYLLARKYTNAIDESIKRIDYCNEMSNM